MNPSSAEPVGEDVAVELWVDPADEQGRVGAGSLAAVGKQETIPLRPGSYTLGLSPPCDILVDGARAPLVALLDVTACRATLRPIAQDTLVTVNGRRGGTFVLVDGDRIQVGQTAFGVRLRSSQPPGARRRSGRGSVRGSWAGVGLIIAAVVAAAVSLVAGSLLLAAGAAVLGGIGVVVAWRSRVMAVATVTQNITRVGSG